MRLADLLDRAHGRPGLADLLVAAGPADDPAAVDLTAVDLTAVEVTAIELDSRRCGPGTLFCAVPGAVVDGHDHAAAAVAAGAVAVLCERPLGLGVAELRVPSVRRAMGPLAAAFHGDPSASLDVVGVTGTNGKTTVTHLLGAILAAAGRPCVVIGTLSGTRTTPEAPELQARLAEAVRDGVQAAAVEVSSHALVQHRVEGTRFRVVAFTNLSQDHLDYHESMEAYFQAKARLFDGDLAERAVVCLDDAHGRLLSDAAQVPTVGYRLADASDVVLDARGTSFTWRGVAMRVRLAGRFNLLNALGAATIAEVLGVAPDAVAAGLAGAAPVRGRFELVDEGQPFVVAVDYAHTPDGLTQVLAAARELVAAPGAEPGLGGGGGRVLVVFGCGGDRDVAKRPLMGEAALAGADLTVLTSDNPRSEPPHAIIEAVLRGIPDPPQSIADGRLMVEPDRRAAIATAIGAARPGDVLVIAGKGHETTQVVGAETIPFDDRVVAVEVLQHQEPSR